MDLSLPLTSCLAVFGQSYTLVRMESGGGEEVAITGIISEQMPEDAVPGTNSAYFTLEILASSVDPDPEKGDEVHSAEWAYVIHRIEKGEDGGSVLHLRKDRELV